MHGVFRPLLPLLFAFLVPWLPGCVERKLLIRTDPPGAVVLLDNQVIGTSPVEHAFTFYGARQVEARWDPLLAAAGRFEPAKETRYLRAPWYQWVGLDLFFELLWPFTITDVHTFDLRLAPRAEEDETATGERMERLIRRAESMRVRTLRDGEEDR